jgi:hypothetical protein
MKRAIRLILVGLGISFQAVRAENEIGWTSAKEVLALFEAVNKAGDGVKFKARSSGQRYFYSINGKEKELINYDQEIFVPAESALELTGRHSSIKIQTIKRGASVVVLAQLRMDNRSVGGKVEIRRAATTIDLGNKQTDLEKAKADALFNDSKTFASDLPTPSTNDQR